MSSALLPSYNRVDLSFTHGEGAWLFDERGERYLDFVAGIAVNALGHAHPHLVAALKAQAEKLWHVSNAFQIADQERLAQRLAQASFADRVFFTNSGTEAVELAIKAARRYQDREGRPERYRLITFTGAFHGRTMAALSAAGNAKYLEGFGPEVDGFDHVPFGDHEALRAAVGPQTAGIMIEPVQGEGGVSVVPPQCLRGLRELCDENDLLLILDEVQCGTGRTGHFFAHEMAGATPDILAVAKGIGGGFPLGACLSTEAVGRHMTAGSHGSTYGGNPLAMAVGNAVLDVVLADGFLEGVRDVSLRLKQKLVGLKDRYPAILKDVRGEGLLLGLQCRIPNTDLVKALRDENMLTVVAADNVVRLLPPLTIGTEEMAEAESRLERALETLSRQVDAAE